MSGSNYKMFIWYLPKKRNITGRNWAITSNVFNMIDFSSFLHFVFLEVRILILIDQRFLLDQRFPPLRCITVSGIADHPIGTKNVKLVAKKLIHEVFMDQQIMRACQR